MSLTLADLVREVQALNDLAAQLRPLNALHLGLAKAAHERAIVIMEGDIDSWALHPLRRECCVLEGEGARVARLREPLMHAYMTRRTALLADPHIWRYVDWDSAGNTLATGVQFRHVGLVLAPIADE